MSDRHEICSSDPLVLRPLFDGPPSPALVAAFRRHVIETGSPETFPQISTTSPPRDGHVVALLHPVDVNKAKREDKGRAPCPICSPSTGKYLSGGTLIWCEQTHAIYAIGPDCSATLWSDDRLNRALNVLRRTEQDKARAAKLRVQGLVAGARLAWIQEHGELARQIEQLQTSLARELDGLRSSLARALKGYSSTTPALAGAAFLEGKWRLTANLSDVQAVLRELEAEECARPGVWVDALSAKVVSERLQRAERANLVLHREADRMSAAAAFLTRKNLTNLQSWSESGYAPIDFSITFAEGTVTIEADAAWQVGDGERWVGPLGITSPRPLPTASENEQRLGS